MASQYLFPLRCAVGASYLALFCYARFLYVRLQKFDRIKHFMESFKDIRSLLRTKLTYEAIDAYENLVVKLSNERRLERSATTRLAALHALIPMMLWDSVCVTREGIWGDIQDDRTTFYYDKKMFPGVVAIVFACLVIVTTPSFNTCRFTDMLFILQGIRTMGTYLSTADAFAFVVGAPLRSFTRLMLSLGCGNCVVTIPINMALCLVQCFAYYRASLNEKEELFPGHVEHFIQRESVVVAITAGFCLIVESTLVSEVRATLKSNSSDTVMNTYQGLLSVLCDVVIHVSDDLKISRPSQQLAALLLNGRSAESLHGSPVADLLNSEDADRFRAWIASGDQNTHAHALNASFKSFGGISVSTKMYHARYEDVTGKIGYIIGISETSSYSTSAPEAEVEPISELPTFPCPSSCHSQGRGSRSNRSRSSESSKSSKRSSEYEGFATNSSVFRVSCDALVDTLPILHSDFEFSLLCGHDPKGKYLLDWIVVPSPPHALAWVKRNFSALLSKESCDAKTLQITLRTPLAERSGIEAKADCTLCLELESNGLQTSSLVAILSFSSVQYVTTVGLHRISTAVAARCALSDTSLPIQQCTLGFSLLCGFHPQGQNILQWIVHPSDFLSWVKQQQHQWQAYKEKSETLELLLQTPLSSHFQMYFVLSCHVARILGSLEDPQSQISFSVEMVFTDFRRIDARESETSLPTANLQSAIRRRQVQIHQ